VVVDMRGIWLILAVAGCEVGEAGEAPVAPEPLRVEPAALDLTVQLDAATPAAFHVMSGTIDVTAKATYAVTGTPLGTVAADGFHSDGRTGGRATITVTYGSVTGTLPVHVVLHASRNAAAAEAPGWFANAARVVSDGNLEPGDGAVLPPDLGGLDVAIDPPAGDDLHDVELLGPDLDVHVYGSGGEAKLNAAEWDAIARTSRGKAVELIARSLATANPTTSHVVSAHVAVADLPLTSEVLFVGARAGEAAQVWSYDPRRGSTQPWVAAAVAVSSDLAISRDGLRIAASVSSAPGVNPTSGGTVLDVASRAAIAPPSPQVGVWTGAAFQLDRSLVTTNAGVLTLRSGDTGLPRANIPLDVLASQPAAGRNGRALAYVTGPMDTVTDPASPQPILIELRVHTWDPATATLGEPLILAPATDGLFVKYPDFSPDDRFVLYSSVPAQTGATGDIMVARADGAQGPTLLASGYDMARFASPITTARSGYADASPMVWIIMQSDQPVGGRDQTGAPQLYAMAFYPELGLASRPFRLPGQDPAIGVLHAPAIVEH
jgi:hypothetical protein